MNRIHRSVWNPHRSAYVAVAETVRSRGKRSGVGGALLAGALLGGGLVAPAFGDPSTVAGGAASKTLPSGGQVTAGQAGIDRSGTTLTVNQGSAKTAIEWSTFSIGKDATVQFVQPSAGAVALNRVTGSEGSVIDGALKANGQVFILNPNGVLFGKGARVDTAGLVATTLGLSDADFLAGKTGFAGHGGAVVNQGSLTAKDGGYIALIGQQVKNDGVITARLGTVALAAGDKVSLNFNGDSLVGVAIDRGALDALVANGGAIRADGGLVVLTAKGAEGLVDTLVNNTGEVRAQTVENKAGRIYLLGEGGKVEVAGTLDASAPGAGDGGFVETSGSKVHVADDARITTLARQGASGHWLIDPTDFTVAESGGDITGAALSSNLASGSVTIQSTSGAHGLNGDIVVNDPVIWGANTTLTLEAQNNIYLFSNITATGASGKLALYYGQGALASGNTSTYTVNGAQVNLQAGQNFDTKQGSDGTVTHWTVITALGAAGSVTGTDLQGINGNPSGNFALGADIAAGATTGWNAGAGFDPLSLSGNFDGLGHKIDGLFINRSSGYTGLFGSTSGTVRNVGVTNADITGGGYFTGALAGYNSGLVEASYATGSVTGDNATGGLVGYNEYSGTVKTSYSSVHVTGGENVGGLVGNNWGYVLDTYATGTVYGLESVGGLIGNGYYSQEVSRSYAVGAVTADVNASYVGGLVAPSNQPIPGTANFWDVTTTGQVASGAGTGLTTAQMTATGTFTGAGWNFTLGSGVWARRDDLNNMYPVLRTFGYTDRIGVATLAPAYFADPTAGLSYTTSGLLTGDAITLAQSGSTLAFTFNNPARAGLYDALMVRSQATTGDLTVNRPVAWSNFQLVLEAAGDINVNAVMTATGTSTLDVKTGYNFNTLNPAFDATKAVRMGMNTDGTFFGRIDFDRTGTGILTINSAGYTLIDSVGTAGSTTATDLQGMAGNLSGNYALASSIDASATAGWNGNAGFTALGVPYSSPFSGILNGLGHSITALTAVDTGGNNIGLFAYAVGAQVRNTRFDQVSLTGAYYAGAVAAVFNNGEIANSSVSGTIEAVGYAGGFIGQQNAVSGGTTVIKGVVSTANVSGPSSSYTDVGGLIGQSNGVTSIDSSTYSGNLSAGTGGYVGGLVGNAGSIAITRSTSAGTLTDGGNGASDAGGLVGGVFAAGSPLATISNSSSAATVVGSQNVGGLVGEAFNLAIDHSSATGSVTGSANATKVGGLVGSLSGSSIVSSYATGNVAAADGTSVGGLVGSMVDDPTTPAPSTVALSYATGAVQGGVNVGGLVGYMDGSNPSFVTIDHSYARGAVSSLGTAGNYHGFGGLVGYIEVGLVDHAYSTGNVAAAANAFVGGLVGGDDNGGSVSNSFWDLQTSGQSTSGSSEVGKTTAQMHDTSLYTNAGWDFAFRTGIWGRKDSANDGYPVLRTFGYTDPLTITVGSTQRVYGDANPALGSVSIAGACAPNCANYVTGAAWGSAITAATGVGAYAYSAANVLGLTFANGYNASMFDITLASTGLTIAPRPVSLATVSGATRLYDRTTDVGHGLFTLGNLVNGDSVSLTGAATLAGANAGVEAVTGVGTLALSNANYTLVSVVPTGSVVVSPRAVSVATVSGATRVYDATTDAAASLLQIGGVLTGDTVHLGGTATLAGKNVGAQAVSAGTLVLDNGNYTLVGVTPTGSVTVTARPVSVATVAGASKVYDGTTDAAGNLLQVGGVLTGDTVNLGGTATLAGKNVGAQAVSAGTLVLDNGNYTLVGVSPTGSVTVTARPVSVATVAGASKVYDGTTDASGNLLQVGGVVAGDTVNLTGTAALAGKNVGAQGVTLGTLALDNANYTLAGTVAAGTIAVLPRTLHLSFVVADKTFDGSTAAGATASDDRVRGDQLSAQFSAAFADTNAGAGKPVAITGLALQGADAGNYQLASGAGSGVTGTLLSRRVTYTLAPQDAAKTYTATGQVLVSAASLDQLVVATFANTVTGTSPGALSYTLWKNGQQVDAIKDAGTYQVRASFAADDAHYALATTGNADLTIVVGAGSAAFASSPVAEVIAQAVRTDVPTREALQATPTVASAETRSPAEFTAMAPNVASRPAGLAATFGEGVPLALLSSPSGEEPSQSVTLEQAKRMVAAPAGSGAVATREVRVPVSRNSLAEIVNGGVKLPGGVDQLLFVVKAGK